MQLTRLQREVIREHIFHWVGQKLPFCKTVSLEDVDGFGLFVHLKWTTEECDKYSSVIEEISDELFLETCTRMDELIADSIKETSKVEMALMLGKCFLKFTDWKPDAENAV